MLIRKLPEETGLGVALLPKNTNVRTEYINFIIANKNTFDYGYEFNYDKDNKPIFITGRENEKGLPLLRFPIVVKTNNVNYIISNLTGTVKAEASRSLLDNKRNDYVDFETTRNLLLFHTLSNKDISYLATLTAQIATTVITKIVSQNLRLDTFNTIDLEGAVFYYFATTYGAFTDDAIKTKMLNLLSLGYRNNPSSVKYAIDNLSTVEKGSSLAAFIRANGSSASLTSIEDKAILAMLSNMWFSGSENSSSQVFMGVEDLHTMASMIYHTLTTATGKKSLLFRIINDAKKNLRVDQFISSVDGLKREYTI